MAASWKLLGMSSWQRFAHTAALQAPDNPDSPGTQTELVGGTRRPQAPTPTCSLVVSFSIVLSGEKSRQLTTQYFSRES